MMKNQCLKMLKQSDGQTMVELALILPILLLLSFGVFEYSRSILTKNIITNMSREGANLAARTQTDPQIIMSAIATTADPLDMGTNGMIFITEVMGIDDGTGTVNPIVKKQYRYVNGGYSANSMVWGGCGSWTGGECAVSGSPIADLEGDGGTISGMEAVINDGETVYAVEVLYDYAPIISYVLNNNPEIYSCNVF
ncbi:MAG: pilus assembly protein [Deltaproteobacteria bacterium]|nr:pilus assembly protein [Deltaproteobacteria bacterium]